MSTINVSLSIPVVSESTYKPAWARTLGKNATFLQSLLQNPTTRQIASSTKGGTVHKVYRTELDEHEHFIFVHDTFKDADSIVYGVKVRVFSIQGMLEFRTLGQVSVWRNSYYPYLPSGFAKWIFLEILYPTYSNIVSDSSQSAKGKAFWYMRIGEELDSDKNIYALGLALIKKQVLHLEEIHEINNIRDVDKYYSVLPDTRGEFFRIMFTKKKLKV